MICTNEKNLCMGKIVDYKMLILYVAIYDVQTQRFYDTLFHLVFGNKEGIFRSFYC